MLASRHNSWACGSGCFCCGPRHFTPDKPPMKGLSQASAGVVLAASATLCRGAEATSGPLLVSTNDFENGAGTVWPVTNMDVTPVGGRRFLGRFGNDTATLSLSNLPPHAAVRATCDLFFIHSWDGSCSDFGPNLWQVAVGDRPAPFFTFNNRLPAHPGNGPIRAKPWP